MDYKTLSASELIDALEHAGRTPNLDLIRVCLERIDELEPALLEILRIDPLKKYNLEDDENPLAYGEIHAGYLLIAARSQAALPIFDEIFRDPERDYLLEWFDNSVSFYGSLALPFFGNLLLDEGAPEYGRSSAATVIAQIVAYEPEYRPIVISTLKKLLPPFSETNEPLIDESESYESEDIRTWAVLELGLLADTESLPQIESLFAHDAINSSLIGDYDAYVERLQGVYYENHFTPFDIMQTYQSLHRTAEKEKQLRREIEIKRQEKEKPQSRLNKLLEKKKSLEEQIAKQATARGERPNSTHETMPGQPSVRKEPKVGRNDPCPCGSGKKYKKCHGRPGQ